ncbi:hypothetical protein D9757_014986 [Collybiopsis confluens]|uniref:Chromatin elongation factor SPT5 n=1 Tax=Collybiopsis confluens TaxID=2823264 RepID=A0A8H5CEA9_9AGAR|nr:hypothetical protein D9757_014986 [Collybiopsis confluens]
MNKDDSSDEYESDDIAGEDTDGEQGYKLTSKRPRLETMDDGQYHQGNHTQNAKQTFFNKLLEDLTQKYGHGGSKSRTVPTEEILETLPVGATLGRCLKTDDWRLWRVKCQVGKEYDVLYQVLSKHEFLSKELRSAFFNPRNPGTIYLEAQLCREDNVTSLYHTLRTLHSVRIRTLTLVPEEDTAACLHIHDAHREVVATPREWVTIKRGLYKGDVGVVIREFDDLGGVQGSEIALVPRLSMSPSTFGKRRVPNSSSFKRPPPALFNPLSCAQDGLRKTDEGYTFGRWTFANGLLLKRFHNSSLTPARIMPSGLLSLFQESKHPLVCSTNMPIPREWRFEIGERVLIKGAIPATILETNAENQTVDGSYVVDTPEGHHVVSPLALEKIVSPGDYAEITAGEFAGRSGFVVARNLTLLSIATGRFDSEPDLWAHVNSVKLTTPSVAPIVTEPWIDLEVKIKSGPFAASKAIVKHVQPDMRGSLRVAVYVPQIFQTFNVDVFNLAEFQTGQFLFDFQPLMAHQQRFRIMPELRAMRTGRVPWLGMKVDIVAGEYKGTRGYVRDVNCYCFNPKTPRRSSELTLAVERLVMSAGASNQLIPVDYDQVRYHRTSFKLAEIFRLSKAQSFYQPMTAVPAFNNYSLSLEIPEDPIDAGSGTPLPTEFERAHIFTGAWSPNSPLPEWDRIPWDSDDVPTLDSCDRPVSNPSAPRSNEVAEPPHWILHPSLIGVAIRVDIRGGPFDTAKKKCGHFVRTKVDSGIVTPMGMDARGIFSAISPSKIFKFHERPKPTSERSLMVVIEGPHTGKFVRSKTLKNAKFIALVVDRSSESLERASEEILELDRDEVELVEERAHERRYMNGVLKDIRDRWRVSKPEIRIYLKAIANANA